MLVGAVCEEVHPLVQLEDGRQRLIAQRCELLCRLACRLTGGALVGDSGLRGFAQVLRADFACCCQCRQSLCGFALCADDSANFLRVGFELCGICARSIAGCHQRCAIRVCLFGALVVGEGYPAHSSRRDGERIHQSQHVAAQRPRRIARAAEHIFELPALLQEHRKWGLPTL